jgi:iron complex outermembrane recepter protein
MFSCVQSARAQRVSATVLSFLLIAFAHTEAQAAPPVQEVVVQAKPLESLGLEESSTTASRLATSILDLPASVSLVSQESLQTRGRTTVVDGAIGVTGLTGFARAGAAGVFSWRGFTENALATLFDGIRVQGSTITTRQYDVFAFDRIEVLRGPASALHGEGALAGAINYVRREPVRNAGPMFEVLASAGNPSAGRVGFGTNVRLTENAHARLDAVYQNFDTDVRGNENRVAHAVGSVLVDLTDRFSMLVQVDALRERIDQAYWGTPLVDGGLDERLRDVNYNNSTNDRYADDVTWLLWRTDWKLTEQWSLRNRLFNYQADRDWRNVGRFLWNAGTQTVGRTFWEDLAYDHHFYGDRLEIGAETQIAGRPNAIAAGIEVSRTAFESPRNYSAPFGLQQQVDPFNPPAVDFFDFGHPRVRARETDLEQWTAFVENRWTVTPRLALHASARHDSIQADFARFDALPTQFYTAHYSPTTWTLGSSLRVLTKASLYAQVGTSATPVDSLLVIGDPATAAFDLTHGRSAEIGFKQQWSDDRLEWSAALYRIEQKNLPSTDPNNPTRSVTVGEQHAQGMELAMLARPGKRWQIEANAAILRARFDRFREANVERAGNRPPNVPERVGNLTVDYAITPQWSASIGGRYVGRFAANTSNAIFFPSYTVIDTAVRYRWRTQSEVALFVRNAADEVYAAWATSAGGQNVMANYGAGRGALLQFRTSF